MKKQNGVYVQSNFNTSPEFVAGVSSWSFDNASGTAILSCFNSNSQVVASFVNPVWIKGSTQAWSSDPTT